MRGRRPARRGPRGGTPGSAGPRSQRDHAGRRRRQRARRRSGRAAPAAPGPARSRPVGLGGVLVVAQDVGQAGLVPGDVLPVLRVIVHVPVRDHNAANNSNMPKSRIDSSCGARRQRVLLGERPVDVHLLATRPHRSMVSSNRRHARRDRVLISLITSASRSAALRRQNDKAVRTRAPVASAISSRHRSTGTCWSTTRSTARRATAADGQRRVRTPGGQSAMCSRRAAHSAVEVVLDPLRGQLGDLQLLADLALRIRAQPGPRRTRTSRTGTSRGCRRAQPRSSPLPARRAACPASASSPPPAARPAAACAAACVPARHPPTAASRNSRCYGSGHAPAGQPAPAVQ